MVTAQPPVRAVQLDEQLAAPPQLSEQPTLQPVILQVSAPEQLRLHEFPGQSRTTDFALAPLAEQLPPEQEKLHDAPPLQVNAQPEPEQLSSQSLLQVHALPATHSSPPQETSSRLATAKKHTTCRVLIAASLVVVLQSKVSESGRSRCVTR